MNAILETSVSPVIRLTSDPLKKQVYSYRSGTPEMPGWLQSATTCQDPETGAEILEIYNKRPSGIVTFHTFTGDARRACEMLRIAYETL